MRAGPSGPRGVTDIVSFSLADLELPGDPGPETTFYLLPGAAPTEDLSAALVAQPLLTRRGTIGRLVVESVTGSGTGNFTLQFLVNGVPTGPVVTVTPDPNGTAFVDMTTYVFDEFEEVLYTKGDVVLLALVMPITLEELEPVMISYERCLIEPSNAHEV